MLSQKIAVTSVLRLKQADVKELTGSLRTTSNVRKRKKMEISAGLR
jgi:hypothetical protein